MKNFIILAAFSMTLLLSSLNANAIMGGELLAYRSDLSRFTIGLIVEGWQSLFSYSSSANLRFSSSSDENSSIHPIGIFLKEDSFGAYLETKKVFLQIGTEFTRRPRIKLSSSRMEGHFTEEVKLYTEDFQNEIIRENMRCDFYAIKSGI